MNYHALRKLKFSSSGYKKKSDLKYSVIKNENTFEVINSDCALRFERKSNYDYHDYFYSFPLCFPSKTDNGIEVKLNICL